MAVSTFHRIAPTISRRPSGGDTIRRLWRGHAHQVGEVVTAWNDLHASFFYLFETLSGANHPRSREIAHAIWHSIQSDNTQREMMLRVALVALPPKSRTLAQVKWLKETADKMAKMRNDPAHTQISF